MEPAKPWKPAFIVFVDIFISMTFCIVSILYFWVQIPNTDVVDTKRKNWGYQFAFVPTNVVILQVVMIGKNIGNIVFLKGKYGLEKANSSKVTNSLFWFRVTYDFLVIGGSIILFSIFKKDIHSHHPEHSVHSELGNRHHAAKAAEHAAMKHLHLMMGNDFIVWVIFVPFTILEISIGAFCKVPAEYRQIYQELGRKEWPKGKPNPAVAERERMETFESIQKHFRKM
jgi:hypothetical protein